MTERTFHAELTSREFPYNFKELSSTVIFNQGSEIQRGVPGGIQGADSEKSFGVCQAYYLDNVLPISRGYSSIGFTAAVPELDLSSEIIAGFTVRGTGAQIALFVATQTNAYVYDPNGGQWQELELSGTSAELVSYAFVKEVTYIYYGYKVYVYNFDSQELQEVDLIAIDESVIKGIASAGSHLIAWDDTTIYRSSVLDPLDFDPLNGLSTGAGSTKVLAIKGNIIVCLALGEDFVIYTSNNAVSARQTGQLQFPFVYKEIKGSAGIESAQHVAHDSNQGNHISWTASGFQQVNVESAEYIWPELGDGITRGLMSVIDPEFFTPLFVRVDSIQVKLNFVSNRWVVVSTRALPFTATSTYTDAYVYDTLLGRWGKLTVPHATFLEFSLPEVFSQYTYQQFGTDYQLYSDIPESLVYAQLGDSDRASSSKAGTNFGLLRSNGEVYSVSWAETSEFRGETEIIGAARSRIIMGKFKPFRTRGMIHQSLKVTRLFDANLKLYGHDYTGNYVALKNDLVQNEKHLGQWFGRLNSDSVSIGLDGVFLLTDLSFVATDSGKINQRYGELEALLIATTDTYPLETQNDCCTFTGPRMIYEVNFNYWLFDAGVSAAVERTTRLLLDVQECNELVYYELTWDSGFANNATAIKELTINGTYGEPELIFDLEGRYPSSTVLEVAHRPETSGITIPLYMKQYSCSHSVIQYGYVILFPNGAMTFYRSGGGSTTDFQSLYVTSGHYRRVV